MARPPPPFAARPAAVVLAFAAGPAAADSGFAHGLSHTAWLVLGFALGVAATFIFSSRVLSERVAPHRTWWPFALAALAAAPAVGALAIWLPWPAIAASLVLAGWGLLLVDRLARRMLDLLEERDRARAEAKRAKQDSERDALTGVLNRGALRKRLERLAEETQQDNRPLSLLYFDLDLFKLINDSLGHGVGDDCLRAVAATVGAELRGGDVLGRLGGEEFAVVLPGARRIHAIAVGERIRTAVQQHCRIVGEEVVELTVSIGAAEYLGLQEAIDALMDRADRAMYQAKDSGRNMVVADPAMPASAN